MCAQSHQQPRNAALLPRVRVCPSCQAHNTLSRTYCTACGAPLSNATADPPAPLGGAAARDEGSDRYPGLPERFLIHRLLGRGAQKQVYLAHDIILEREVAIAVIDTTHLGESALARIRREVRAMARVSDRPHMVTIFDTIERPNVFYIVSQYMRGGDLATALARLGTANCPPERTVQIGAQVCQALEYAHGIGITHRDLKPGNIFLDEHGNAYLGDFGLARDLEQPNLTLEGTVLGTPAYMAPEQATGAVLDWRCDLYALGCVLYECLTGQPPFSTRNLSECLAQHLHAVPVPPVQRNSAVPAPLNDLILQLLGKRPEDRPQSAAAVRQRLAEISAGTAGSTAAATPRARSAATGNHLVGRTEERSTLTALVDRGVRGSGAVVLLSGDAGIGKSCLAGAVADYARSLGALVLVGRSYAGEGVPAYWPWVEVLRALRGDPDAQRLATAYQTRNEEIALLLPSQPRTASDAGELNTIESAAGQFQLFDSVSRFLLEVAEQRPLVLVLEDLHWADHSSLLLLEFIAGRIGSSRILICTTYRETEPDGQAFLSRIVASLTREGVTERLRLRGIPRQAAAALVEDIAGSCDGTLVDAIYERSEGNPFFIKELARHLLESDPGAASSPSTVPALRAGREAEIPSTIREVVWRRIEHVGAPLHRVLTTAAILGRQFRADVLSHACEMPVEALEDLLEVAVRGHVIEVAPERPQAYRFSHALIRETLLSDIVHTQRIRLHALVGTVLERLYGVNAVRHAAELAHHFLHGLPHVPRDAAVRYAMVAGRDATARFAYDEAAGHYQRTLAVVEEDSALPAALRCELLLAMAEAQYRAGMGEKTLDAFLAAAELARSTADAVSLARAALGLSGTDVPFGAHAGPVATFLVEALDALGPNDSSIKARVLSRLASLPAATAEAKRLCRERADAAIRSASRLQDREALAFALAGQHTALAGPEYLQERIGCAQQLVDVATAARNTEMCLEGRYSLIVDLLESGDQPGVVRESAAFEALAHAARQKLHLWRAARIHAMRALYEGALSDAERWAHAAFERGKAIATVDPFLNYVIQIFRIRWEQGRLGELEGAVKALVRQQPDLPAARCAVALVDCVLGHSAEGRMAFDLVATHDFADLPLTPEWTTSMSALAETCALLGDERRAYTLYAMLEPYRCRNLVVGATCYYGSGAYYLGLLAATMKRWTIAQDHFESALAMHRRMEARPLTARTLYQFGKMCLMRDDVDTREQGAQMLSAALAMSGHIGMQTLQEAVSQLLRSERQAGSNLL